MARSFSNQAGEDFLGAFLELLAAGLLHGLPSPETLDAGIHLLFRNVLHAAILPMGCLLGRRAPQGVRQATADLSSHR